MRRAHHPSGADSRLDRPPQSLALPHAHITVNPGAVPTTSALYHPATESCSDGPGCFFILRSLTLCPPDAAAPILVWWLHVEQNKRDAEHGGGVRLRIGMPDNT